MSGEVLKVDDANFDADVLRSALPVLVDFGAEWCAPCKAIEPILDEVAAEYRTTLTVVRVDMDANLALAQRYAVRGMPSLLFFKDGQVQAQKVGALSKSQLRAFIEANL
ncbi:MAG TPA: thioredoxin [Gammaproteobacteria bacterium]|nr:thioredoxin [Gammaproteobacteria bacterium]